MTAIRHFLGKSLFWLWGTCRKLFIKNPLTSETLGSRLLVWVLFLRSELVFIKQRALRRAMWFKVLDRVERIIINLAMRCVERVRSSKLARIIATIVTKLTDAMKSRFKRSIEDVGRPLARRMSQIARAWGYVSAIRWAKDSGFIQYLAVTQMIAPLEERLKPKRTRTYFPCKEYLI